MSERSQIGGDGEETRARIVDAARVEISRAGWAAASSGRVARRTGVSKALIHYHFEHKDALLCAVAERCRHDVMARGALTMGPARHTNPVDGFSDWLESELTAQDLRVALNLRMSGRTSVVRAADAVLATVRAELERQQHLVFEVLGVVPSLPQDLIVDVLLTMAEGAALAPVEPPSHRRRMVEALWLCLLSVTG
ncbi:MAG TPA: helix-turn-helix domain-containing protein [Gemmatimonadaceae bacterium]